jgi:hypothetical protein
MYRILIISKYSTIFPFLTNYSVISEFLNEYCLTYYEQYLIQTNKYLWLPVAYFIVFSLHFRYSCILMKLKQSIQYIYIYCNGVLIKLWLTDWSWMSHLAVLLYRDVHQLYKLIPMTRRSLEIRSMLMFSHK